MSSDERVDHALESLHGLAGEPPWRDTDQIRRLARRRTISRRSLLGVAGLAVAGGVVDTLLPDRSPSTPAALPHQRLGKGVAVNDRAGSAVELVADVQALPTTANDIRPVATAQQQFALDLLRVTPASTSNVVLSPSSLATALAMLQVGAAGRTRDEIARALHTDQLSSQQQALGWAALTASLADTGVLESANSVWQQRNFPLAQTYLAQLARYFDTGVWQVDFQRHMDDALSAINTWCGKQTHGRITKLFEPGALDPATTKLVLANAEYFKAAWKYRFNPDGTAPAPFHRADGSTVQAPFMSFHGKLATTATSRYVAARFPYAGDRFSAQLIEPTSGSLDDLIAALTPEDLHSIAAATVSSEPLDVLVPRFTAQTYTDLKPSMQKLGMTTAFTDSADFTPMSRAALAVETIVQRDFLKVDEQGTEAAAVTGVGIQIQAARPPLAFDHPFLFLVRDDTTGVILFAAQIVDPSASS